VCFDMGSELNSQSTCRAEHGIAVSSDNCNINYSCWCLDIFESLIDEVRPKAGFRRGLVKQR
jgi:hypothetical protein